MDNKIYIKEKLDTLYKEYKQKDYYLSNTKTKEVSKLLVELTFNENGDVVEVASQLSRFSPDVVNFYFETITKDKSLTVDLLDEVIKVFLQTDKDVSRSQFYVRKFVFAVTSVMKNYKEKALMSAKLPRLVVFIAKFAVKSKKYRNNFQTLIDNTEGRIFVLDYSGINKSSLMNMWNATNAVFPDRTKARYEAFILEWAEKYGFIQADSCSTADINNKEAATEKAVIFNEVSALADKSANKTAETADSKAESISAESVISAESLYINLKQDMSEGQERIVAAVTDMITPIGKALETIQGELRRSRETEAENVLLKAKTEALEHQLSEARTSLQSANQTLMSVQTENDELKKQISELESQNSELDSKLNDAYAINSRHSSLEAERVRSELKRDFLFLYEDWLEYEFSDVSEVNYESLQAIIKKVFRSLERNGIDFKGNY